MKLLDEISSTKVARPTRGRVFATMSITLTLVLGGTFFGYAMVTGTDDDPGDSPVPMSSWVEEATAACVTVTEEHPVLTQGPDARTDGDNAEDVDAGVTALATAISELPTPEDASDEDTVNEIIELGNGAAEAWNSAAEGGSEDDVDEASSLTSTFVDELVDLGADCSALN
ncbi:hypothetical protein EF847_21510 [Actinobacteria bacterium YIM 96077]|uniref:Uncharacterized protein n=1 Tax=Phytoactinopolyspora halophila TaxID=1981511 RepID=A0A329QSN2_9ACTN|nr:hypothetical protein [Phytoactinopolyspora halophila]AYY14877.1 hypothetical protein EF847_21510 [Actinobacteria bacterium YIM 96077]RAW15335.1 hypothetical protein DPM12_08740 [Phytoactinopolyspora halophila]